MYLTTIKGKTMKKKNIIFILFFVLILAGAFYGQVIKGEFQRTPNPYVHIDEAHYNKKTDTFTLRYRVTQTMPNGYTIQLGMGYSPSYRIPDKTIRVKNKIGTYTQKFTNVREDTQVYLKETARDYSKKTILKKQQKTL